jgi:2-phosphosulfolactate phosphatase
MTPTTPNPLPPIPRPELRSIEVLFTPADFGTLPGRDLSRTTCVVFDVLRATTSMITALANGAVAIIPVAEIAEAVALRAQRPGLLLAGERNGLRILADQTGGLDFDFGNSPREFTANKVHGRTIVSTTTNGTRALRACAGAQTTLVGAFLNLGAVADWIERHPPENLVVVCSGTFEQAAYEDALAAGALLELLSARFTFVQASDAVHLARQAWRAGQGNLLEAVQCARNARKLLGNPALAADVPFSLQRDTVHLVARLTPIGEVKSI